MAFSDFFMSSAGGDNLNAGSGQAGGGAIGSGAAVYSTAAGDWDGTSVFTPNDGSTPASSLTPNVDWLSVYPTGNVLSPYCALITSITAGANGPITCSTTVKLGTPPASSSGTHNRGANGGGAWADFGMVGSGGAIATGTVAVPTRFNVSPNTFANTNNLRTMALAGTAASPVWWRGRNSSGGDPTNTAVAGTDIPNVTFTTGRIELTGVHNWITGMLITSATTSASRSTLYISGAQCRVFGCRVLNTAANSNGIAVFLAVGTVVARCYLNTTSSAAIGNQNIAGGAWLGNVFDGGANGLAIAGSNPVLVYGNLFLGQAGDAVNAAGGTANIINNSVYGLASGGGNGFAWSTAPGTTCTIAGNYFERVTTASKYCINSTNTPSTLFVLVANGYFNCTAFANGLGDTPSFFDNGLLASSGFANAAGGDFSPTSVMKNVGWPGLFENTSIYRGYPDLGAVQAQTSAGGGTVVGSPFPGMSGLLAI